VRGTTLGLPFFEHFLAEQKIKKAGKLPASVKV
jgi:hypothetical protein